MKIRSRNTLALFAIVLWGCTAIGAFVRAQDTPRTTPPTAPASDTLDDAGLKQMLTTMGYQPTNLSKGYLVAIKEGTWTLNVQVVLSQNGEKLGLNANAGAVEDPAAVPAATWLALLESNSKTEPTIFYFDGDKKKLYLHRVCDNRGITAAILRREIDTFCNDVTFTAPLWKFTK